MTTVEPVDHGRALLNPGMGFTFPWIGDGQLRYSVGLDAGDTLDWFPGCNVVYFRVGWREIQPEERRFNWGLTDFIAQHWIARGKQVAFCWFHCHPRYHFTPGWLRDAGARGYLHRYPRHGTEIWQPNEDDPVFLEKLGDFLAAAAARYDGQPHVAYVDIGSLGTFGEGQVGHDRDTSLETKKLHIDLWRDHFRTTTLNVNENFAMYDERGDNGKAAIEHARQRGCGLTDWSIMVRGGRGYTGDEVARSFWPSRPVDLECEHYTGAVNRGHWDDGGTYLEAVEDYHASYARIHAMPRDFLNQNRELIDRMNRRLGYRLHILRASWPDAAEPGSTVHIALRWRNAGVAPCYVGGHPAVTVTNAASEIVATAVDREFDVRTLGVGRPADQALAVDRAVPVALPDILPVGVYRLHISVGDPDGRPMYALPHPGDDGQRRYAVGELRVGC